MNKLIEAAEALADVGFNPIPVKADKSPMTDERKQMPWHNQLIDDIPRRFAKAEKMAICCGRISNYLYCMDFDCHGGKDISSVFRDFTQSAIYKWLYERNAISVYTTPSGGYHIWFQTEYDMPGQKLAMWSKNDVMIETRGTGQYAVCYPSPGYVFVGGCELESITPIEEHLAHSLLSTARTFDVVGEVEEPKMKIGTQWPVSWPTNTPDGKYNEECGEEALQLLIDSGWSLGQVHKSTGVVSLYRPGKKPPESISATWGKRRNMFYNFSSSAEYFEPNRAYSPFQIYTALNHAGDWKAAKNELRARFKMANVEKAINEVVEEVEDFPISCYPEEMRAVIYEYNRVFNFSIDYMALSMACIVGAVVGNKYKLRVKHGYNAPLVFWGCLVGSPGANKSHPLNALLQPVKSLDAEMRKHYKALMAEWEALDEKEQKKTPKPGLKRIRVNDTTIEALIDIHQINNRGILNHKDELLSFFNDMTRYKNGGSSDRQFWLTSMNNDEWTVDRVTSGHKHIDNVFINIVGTIQHEPLYRVAIQSDDDGLIQRFLFTKSMEKAYGLSKGDINPNIYALWHDMIKTLHHHCAYTGYDDTEFLTLSDELFEYAKVIDDKYVDMQNSKEHPAIVESYLAKVRTYLHRFALLMCVFDAVSTGEEMALQPTHYDRADKIVSYFVNTFVNLMGTKDELQEIKRIVSMMKSKTNKEIIVHLASEGFKQTTIAKALGITKQAVYKTLKSTENQDKTKK